MVEVNPFFTDIIKNFVLDYLDSNSKKVHGVDVDLITWLRILEAL